MNNKNEFENYCQQFIEHVLKYTYKETNQILSFNNLAYCFKNFCNKTTQLNAPTEKIFNLIKNMVEICDKSVSKM